jgi:hypothetical protein
MKQRQQTEWQINLIDEHGDIVDCMHENTKKAAMNYAEGWCGKDGHNRVVVEKSVWHWQEDNDGNQYDCARDYVGVEFDLINGKWVA